MKVTGMNDVSPVSVSQFHDVHLGDLNYAGYFPLKVEELRAEPSRYFHAVRVDEPIRQAFCDDIQCDPPKDHPHGGIVLFETHGDKNAVRVITPAELVRDYFKSDGTPIYTCDIPRMPVRPEFKGHITVQTRRQSPVPII